MLLLAGLLQAAAPALSVTRIVRITETPGVRDNAIAAKGPDGLIILWDQSPGIDRAGAVLPPVRIWRAALGPGGSGPPAPFIVAHGNQWWPAVQQDARGTWLAYYHADRDRRTGDRDIEIQALDRSFHPKGSGHPVSRDPPAAPLPFNDATPALARGSDGHLVVAWSRGAYDAHAAGYADKDLVLATIREDGTVAATHAVTGPDEVGREMAPALLPISGGRSLLVYVSDSGHAGRPSLYVRTLDSTLRAGPPRPLTSSDAGVTRPSLAQSGAERWISWYDTGANDVRLARFRSDSTLSPSWSLRDLLLRGDFSRYGVPRAGLSGASLFTDGDRLGVAFIATMAFDRAAARAQQDVFLAWISTR